MRQGTQVALSEVWHRGGTIYMNLQAVSGMNYQVQSCFDLQN